MLFDYGPKAKETHPRIQQLYRDEKHSEERVLDIFHAGKFQGLCGHFHAGRYSELAPELPIVSFMREPFQRACSEWLHLQNQNDFTLSFTQFILTHGQRNIQNAYLEGADLKLVGTSEHYGKSVSRINRKLGLNIKITARNYRRKTPNSSYSLDFLSEKDKKTFITNNSKDFTLYAAISNKVAKEKKGCCPVYRKTWPTYSGNSTE